MEVFEVAVFPRGIQPFNQAGKIEREELTRARATLSDTLGGSNYGVPDSISCFPQTLCRIVQESRATTKLAHDFDELLSV